MVMDLTLYETPIKIEFNITRDTEEFNVRAELLQLLNKMKQRDGKLRVKSSIPGENRWEELDSIPEDDHFIEQFQAKEFTYCTHRKVILHMTIITQHPINKLKYCAEVKDYIYEKNIWIKPDRYNSRVESSPGIIAMVDTRLVLIAQQICLTETKSEEKMVTTIRRETPQIHQVKEQIQESQKLKIKTQYKNTQKLKIIRRGDCSLGIPYGPCYNVSSLSNLYRHISTGWVGCILLSVS